MGKNAEIDNHRAYYYLVGKSIEQNVFFRKKNNLSQGAFSGVAPSFCRRSTLVLVAFSDKNDKASVFLLQPESNIFITI